jgi:phosphatidylglycerophosphate synthase
MLSRWVRTWDHKIFRPFLFFLIRLGITPNRVTVASLITISISGLMLAQGRLVLGGLVLICGLCLDSLDGKLARVLHRETRLGAFLDSISDHFGDFAVYLGLLLLYLSRDARLEIIVLFLALFGSLLSSQMRSRAAMVGINTKTAGPFTRFERMLVLLVGLFMEQVFAALCILAVMNIFSAMQQLVWVVQASRMPHKEPRR